MENKEKPQDILKRIRKARKINELNTKKIVFTEKEFIQQCPKEVVTKQGLEKLNH